MIPKTKKMHILYYDDTPFTTAKQYNTSYSENAINSLGAMNKLKV